MRRPRLLPAGALLLAAALVLVACGESTPSATPPPSGTSVIEPPLTSAPSIPPSPLEGVPIAVTSAGLGQVESFTLRTADGATHEFVMGTLENAAEFPPAHLSEHVGSSTIRVFFRPDAAGRLVVYRIEDAG